MRLQILLPTSSYFKNASHFCRTIVWYILLVLSCYTSASLLAQGQAEQALTPQQIEEQANAEMKKKIEAQLEVLSKENKVKDEKLRQLEGQLKAKDQYIYQLELQKERIKADAVQDGEKLKTVIKKLTEERELLAERLHEKEILLVDRNKSLEREEQLIADLRSINRRQAELIRGLKEDMEDVEELLKRSELRIKELEESSKTYADELSNLKQPQWIEKGDRFIFGGIPRAYNENILTIYFEKDGSPIITPQEEEQLHKLVKFIRESDRSVKLKFMAAPISGESDFTSQKTGWDVDGRDQGNYANWLVRYLIELKLISPDKINEVRIKTIKELPARSVNIQLSR